MTGYRPSCYSCLPHTLRLVLNLDGYTAEAFLRVEAPALGVLIAVRRWEREHGVDLQEDHGVRAAFGDGILSSPSWNEEEEVLRHRHPSGAYMDVDASYFSGLIAVEIVEAGDVRLSA